MESLRSNAALTTNGYRISKATFDPVELKSLKEELTVQAYLPPSTAGLGPPPPHFAVYTEDCNYIYLPKAFGLSRFGRPLTDELPAGDSIRKEVVFSASLRAEQKAPIDAFIAACKDPKRLGGVLSLGCAAGKTVMALYCISVLRKRTLVVVHKDFLLEQWKSRIEEFLPNASVGLVKAKTIDIEGHDIVLASLQSLSMKEYPANTFDGLGFLIVDETHRIATEVFSRALTKISARYTLGLSATVERKDKLHRVFLWWLGDVVYAKKRDIEEVSVRIIPYFSSDPEYSKESFIRCKGGEQPNTAAMINRICAFRPRTQLVAETIAEVIAENPERRILVLCDRKAMLHDLNNMLREEDIDCGFYYGGLKQQELDVSAEKQVVLATFAMSSEGLDIPALNCLVLCSPKSEIEQSVGRILRKQAQQRSCTPLIIDIVDGFSVFQTQGMKRKRYYRKCKYGILEDGADTGGSDEGNDKKMKHDFSKLIITDDD
jgi:superfamily II DNA or RNA helicase